MACSHPQVEKEQMLVNGLNETFGRAVLPTNKHDVLWIAAWRVDCEKDNRFCPGNILHALYAQKGGNQTQQDRPTAKGCLGPECASHNRLKVPLATMTRSSDRR
jgi:hypothetical protein